MTTTYTFDVMGRQTSETEDNVADVGTVICRHFFGDTGQYAADGGLAHFEVGSAGWAPRGHPTRTIDVGKDGVALPFVDIAICTHDRADTLARCLDSLRRIGSTELAPRMRGFGGNSRQRSIALTTLKSGSGN